jgi:NADH-quinone oxidoreductase subunit E
MSRIIQTQEYTKMNTMDIQFSAVTLAKAEEILKRYPEGKQKSAVLPLLHLAQGEFEGWLSVPVMDYVALILQVHPIEVYEVASFYSMFNLKPVGRCHIEVCRTSSCWLMGAEDIIRHLEQKLGIEVGETTPDGQFTLKTVECLGACGYAPMFQVGDKFYEHLTIEKVDELIETFRNEYAEQYSAYL